MQLAKFTDMEQQVPFLRRHLDRGEGIPENEIGAFIRKKLTYAARRPFLTLDLQSIRVRMGEQTSAKERRFHEIDFIVTYHLEGESTGKRYCYAGLDMEFKETTIEQTIEKIRRDHPKAQFDHILECKRRMWHGELTDTLLNMSIEIYPVPAGYSL